MVIVIDDKNISSVVSENSDTVLVNLVAEGFAKIYNSLNEATAYEIRTGVKPSDSDDGKDNL